MYTINQDTTAEIIEKKSKFIAHTFYIETKEEAEEIISKTKKQYFDARHNVYAYRLIESSKSSDDGEPSGTAGAPILNILESQNIVNTLVVVTRYFGGILLGTGGLVRAYTEATTKALQQSNIIQIVPGYLIKLDLEYNQIDNLIYYCKQNNINIIKTEYLSKIELLLEIDKDKLEDFKLNTPKINNNLPTYAILKEINIKKIS